MDERKLEEKELLTVDEAIKLFNLSRGKFKRPLRKAAALHYSGGAYQVFK